MTSLSVGSLCEKWGVDAYIMRQLWRRKIIICVIAHTSVFTGTTLKKAASGWNWAQILLTCVHLILVVLAFKAKREQARVRSCLLKRQGRLASDYKSARQKQNKGNQSQGKDKTTTTKKIPPGSQIVKWYVLKQGKRAQEMAEIMTGYIWTCVWGFWVW